MSSSSAESGKSRAKIVISDLHLGEGRRNWDGSINVLEDFTVDSKFVEFIDFFSKAYDELELILNGNFLEMMRCRAVVDSPDIIYETYALDIVRLAISGHPQVFEALRRFMENPGHRLVYVMGNADCGVLWTKVQDELRAAISPRMEFRSHHYRDGGVYVEHGHAYDPFLSIDSERAFAEKDSLSVLQLPWGAFFSAHFIQPLRALRPQFYRVRPMGNYMVWAFLFETLFFVRIVTRFFRVIWKALRLKSYPGRRWWTLFGILLNRADPDALEERAEILLTEEGLQKVIFGHTRLAGYRQFSSGKEYFNSGTWTRNLSLDLRSLGAFHRLTYVLVEYSVNAEPQAKLMEWFGKYEVIEDYV